LGRQASIPQTAATTHHRVKRGHHEGDVVQRIVVGVTECQRVVIHIAVHEGHDLRAVGKHEAKRVFEKCLRGRNGVAIEHRVCETHRLVGRRWRIGCATCIAVHDLEAATVGVTNHDRAATGGIASLGHIAHDRAARGHGGLGDGRQRIGAACPQCDAADRRGAWCRVQREQMMVTAAATKVARAAFIGGQFKPPRAGVEIMGRGKVGHRERHAAQGFDPGGFQDSGSPGTKAARHTVLYTKH
jgi:hypothetical protein